MIKDKRKWSYQIGKHFLIAELLRRGYSPDTGVKKGEYLRVTSPSGKEFRIKFRSTVGDMSWLIEDLVPDPSLYFVLIRSNATPPYKPPQYWIMTSEEMKTTRNERMDGASDAKNLFPKHIEGHENKWDILPQ